MSEPTQTYANHTRWHPPFHFVASPILLLHFLWTCYQLYKDPGLPTAEAVLLAIGLIIILFLTRINALRAQDRLIRLEEQLRYQRLLPADLAARASELPVSFIVALRFASDGELAGLVQSVLAGKFAKPAEVKKAIQQWRGDTFRV
jgi:hypothetical protein